LREVLIVSKVRIEERKVRPNVSSDILIIWGYVVDMDIGDMG
jgi:hypothetical protein